METRVQNWGDSLAVRIPKPIADQMGLEPNSPVELTLRGTELVVVPVGVPCLTLADLLAQVTEDNVHREVEIEPVLGGN